MRHLLCSILLFSIFHGLIAQNTARHGMVVCDNLLASEVGVEVMKEGGNAIDAAIAAAFALAVVDPDAGNIGGGGFLVYRDSTGYATTIDFREKAPMKAHAYMYLDGSGKRVDNHRRSGIQGIGVPGTVAGLYLAHQKYGRLPWTRLVQPAIDLARDGFPLPYGLAQQAEQFYTDSRATEFMKKFFTNEEGELLGFGDTWRQPALAHTLVRIRDEGRDGFYQGEVANRIHRFMREHNGWITRRDLRRYKAIERPPVMGTYRDYEIISMPPPSSGGVVLIEMLNMFERARSLNLRFNTARYYHILIEIMRRGYADRAEYLGDPDFNPNMPLEELLSKDHARRRYESIDPERASVSDSIHFGRVYEGDHTTHLSVVDSGRNAVSLTYTLEQAYGSKTGSPELGFLFNNQMRDFNPRPGYTDTGWLIGTEPNRIAPEKRMLSSMTPAIASRQGSLCFVIGSPGGRTIINTVFQTLIAYMEYGLPVEQAIEAPKIHHQWFPDEARYEAIKVSPDTAELLRRMGHKTVPHSSPLGILMGIEHQPESGVLFGHSDSDSWEGAAVGY